MTEQVENKETKKTTENKGYYIPFAVADTWAGAVKEFIKQLGMVTVWVTMCLFVGQGCGFLDIYRLLGK